MSKYDFSGWATKHDIKCSDGRTIRAKAFEDCDGITVPLVWQHKHDSPANVVGSALLKYEPEGVYTYCSCNDTEMGKIAKELVAHGDITSLSIYANRLKQTDEGDVLHGMIREVSLVLTGANPGAYIDQVSIAHSGDGEFEAVIYNDGNILAHSDDNSEATADIDSDSMEAVFKTLNQQQKNLVSMLVGMAMEHASNSAAISHSYEEQYELDPTTCTIEDVYENFTPAEKAVVNFMIGVALDAGEQD